MARIIIIDDDVVTLSTVSVLLQRMGHTAVTVSSSGEAITAFTNGGADIILTDIFMPFTDGLETLKRFKQLDPTIRVVCMSGGPSTLGDPVTARDSILHVARGFGADGSITKPLDPARLKSVIDQLLKDKTECGSSTASSSADTTGEAS